MIGLALVTIVAVLAAGITSPRSRSAVDKIWTNADYAITAQNNFVPIPIAAANAAAKAPGVEAIGNVRTGDATRLRQELLRHGGQSGRRSMFVLDWKKARQAVFRTLGADGAFIDDGYAKKHKLQRRVAVHADVRERREEDVPRSRASSTRRRAVRRSGP